MPEHEDRSRWGPQDPDTSPDPSDDPQVGADEVEVDEEPVVAVQPGQASDVPWDENQAAVEADNEGEGE